MHALWLEFINSYYEDWRGSGKKVDRLEQTDWLAAFIKKCHFPYETLTADKEQLISELRDLRGMLVVLVHKLADGEGLEDEEIEALNKLLSKGKGIRQLKRIPEGERSQAQKMGGEFQIIHVPLEPGLAQLKAQLTLSFTETLVRGETERMKVCDNPDCRWIYYDETKNRSKRYCDDKTCGNLMKVRRHRARKKSLLE